MPRQIQVPYPVEVEKFVNVPYDVERTEYVDVEHIIEAPRRSTVVHHEHTNNNNNKGLTLGLGLGLLPNKGPFSHKFNKLKAKKLKKLVNKLL